MTLNLQGITTKAALHMLFKEQLHFPTWYGANWQAFWDCITTGRTMPAELRLENWQEFGAACPQELAILRRMAADYAAEVPGRRIVLA